MAFLVSLFGFVSDSVNDQLRVRLCDTALSRDLHPADYHCLGDNENRPIKWMALESIARKEHTSASDVVSRIFLAFNNHPFCVCLCVCVCVSVWITATNARVAGWWGLVFPFISVSATMFSCFFGCSTVGWEGGKKRSRYVIRPA